MVGALLKLVSAVLKTFRLSTMLPLALAIPTFAQQSQPPAMQPASMLQAASLEVAPSGNPDRMPDPNQGLIRVDVHVGDKAGMPVTGLSEKDFTLLDNDRRQKILTFRSVDGASVQATPSIEVVIVLDELNMLQDSPAGMDAAAKSAGHVAKPAEQVELRDAVREVETFLRAHGGVLREPTIIYRLTADGLFATPHPSMDGNELADEIEQPSRQRQVWPRSAIAKDIGDSRKGGALSWRITHSIIALGSISIEERRRPERKLLFWVGNGWQIENRSASDL